jgi:hypothetical protein
LHRSVANPRQNPNSELRRIAQDAGGEWEHLSYAMAVVLAAVRPLSLRKRRADLAMHMRECADVASMPVYGDSLSELGHYLRLTIEQFKERAVASLLGSTDAFDPGLDSLQRIAAEMGKALADVIRAGQRRHGNG